MESNRLCPWSQIVSLDDPARVLVVMDQHLLAEAVVLTLKHGRYAGRVVPSVPEAAMLLDEWRPHLAVVDMDLGDDDLIRRLGLALPNRGTTIPVLALTRRGDLKTKLASFAQGVDDIMTIPFLPEELLARVIVLTRRAYGEAHPLQPTIQIGEIEIDILNRQVRAGASVIHLSGLEQHLLYFLAANAGRVVTRDEILDALWGVDFVAESNIVDHHVRELRVKLQDDWRRPRFIATVPGCGYRFLPTFSGAVGCAGDAPLQ